MQHNTWFDVIVDLWEAARDSSWTWKAVVVIALVTAAVLALLYLRR